LLDEFVVNVLKLNALQNGNTRFIKVQIVNESLVPTATEAAGSTTYEQDFVKATNLMEPTTPCYIVYRLDSKSDYGYQWILMAYTPDKAKVRDKMTYAATRATLKRQLGGNYFVNEIFGTIPKDFSKESYQKFVQSQHADAPLTQAEQALKEEMEQGVVIGGTSTYVHGVTFPVAQDVIESFKRMKQGQINYIQLIIDANQEKINLADTKNLSRLSDVSGLLSTTEPRFHFFNWTHEYDGKTLTSLLFIYSCPDGSGNTKSAPVKLRMLYSTSKANAENVATSAGLEVALKLEINKGADIVEENVYRLLHPEAIQQQKQFAKPMRPGKGQRKLIRNN
jgi:twinfilin-like protein